MLVRGALTILTGRQILGLMVVRKMLDMVFSQHDLAWLDDLLPGKEKKAVDEKKKERSKKKVRGEEDGDNEVRDKIGRPHRAGLPP